MLTNLLPGLRELRAPLIAGVLLLVSVVLFFSDNAHEFSSSDSRGAPLADLISWAGRPGLVATTFIAAYLVGSIVVSAMRSAFGRLNRRAVKIHLDEHGLPARDATTAVESIDRRAEPTRAIDKMAYHYGFPYTEGSLGRYREVVLGAPFSAQRRDGMPVVETLADDVNQRTGLQSLLLEPLGDGGRRLLVASEKLFGDFDRKQSEAELRDALLVPAPLACVAVLLNVSASTTAEIVIGTVLVVVLAALFGQARRLDREAYSLVLLALADHTISIPCLDPYEWSGGIPRRRKPTTS